MPRLPTRSHKGYILTVSEECPTIETLAYIPYNYLSSAQGPEYRRVEIARTQATCPASNQPLSQYGHKSAYCWAQTEPSRASSTYQEPGYSYLDSAAS